MYSGNYKDKFTMAGPEDYFGGTLDRPEARENPKYVQQLKEGKAPLEYLPWTSLASVAKVMQSGRISTDLVTGVKTRLKLVHM